MNNVSSSKLVLLSITSQGRKKLVDDIFQLNPSLYKNILYSEPNEDVFKVQMELYDLSWLKYHWDKLNEYISSRRIKGEGKAKLITTYAWWYKEFLDGYSAKAELISNSVPLMEELLLLKIGTLESIIDFDERCNQNMRKVETSFRKSLKLLNDELKIIAERK